jgi:glycine cleavage system aminomethyltransferase T
VIGVFATLFQTERAKYLEIPASHYSTHPYDAVLKNGQRVGLSTYSAYSSNGRAWISLAMVDEAHGATGTEVSVLWGEPDGGSSKPVVERHVQAEIRATVGPWPYSEVARQHYRPRPASRA